MENDIKVSIITVCYNSSETLARTIESVAGQTYTNIEYIIIDGASTDNTLQIIKQYENVITYWQSEPDCGIYDAMNKGTNFATGELISFLNSDDWYTDKTIETVVDAYRKSKADVLYGDCFFVDEAGETITISHKNANLNDFFYRMPISHPSTFVRMTLQKKYGFDKNYRVVSDYKFLSYLYYTGKKFHYINKPLSFFSYGGLSTKKYLYHCAKEVREVSENHLKSNKSVENNIENQKKIAEYYKLTIRNLILARMDKYHFYSRWIYNKFSQTGHIMIFGAGKTGKECFLRLNSSELSVQAFLDNCPQLHHRFIFNVEILSPEILRGMRNVYLFIASEKYEKEIYHQLRNMNLHESIKLVLYTSLTDEALKAYLKHLFGSNDR